MELKKRSLKELNKAKADFERTLKANEEKQNNYFLAMGIVEKHRIEEDNTILRNELKKIEKAIKEKEKEIKEAEEAYKAAYEAYENETEYIEKLIDEEYNSFVDLLKKHVPAAEKARDELASAGHTKAALTGNSPRPIYSVWDALRNKLDDFRTVISDVI
ncbi:MAG TPA: hypothetical protein P5107_10570 [Thermotogota bacterium]|nr:hypothetical protein [Thermotogota bacterium]